MKRPQDSINILPLVQAAVGHTDPWEAAYLRFETPEQEISKFSKRLIKMGALDWSKDPEDCGIVLRPWEWAACS
jgi:hypothetical protein